MLKWHSEICPFWVLISMPKRRLQTCPERCWYLTAVVTYFLKLMSALFYFRCPIQPIMGPQLASLYYELVFVVDFFDIIEISTCVSNTPEYKIPNFRYIVLSNCRACFALRPLGHPLIFYAVTIVNKRHTNKFRRAYDIWSFTVFDYRYRVDLIFAWSMS